MDRILPSFSLGGRHGPDNPFLRAELMSVLRRGPQCKSVDVQRLLNRRASLLGVDGGDDILGVALESGCNAPVLEALLLACAPVSTQDRQNLPTAAPTPEKGRSR
jgi:hypothetical protein